MHLKDADRLTINADPDQTAPESGSTLFAQTCLSKNLGSLWYLDQLIDLQVALIQPKSNRGSNT